MAQLVLALDRDSRDISSSQLFRYLECGVDYIKLTAASFFSEMWNQVKFAPGVKVFLDLKVADISFGNNQGTIFKILEAIAKEKTPISHVSVHGFTGRNGIREAVAGGRLRGGNPVNILVLSGMTDPNYSLFFQLSDTKMMSSWASDEGAAGVILPANRLSIIEQVREVLPDIPIWSPGFGRQSNFGSIYEHLASWRAEVGDDPGNAAIVGSYLLDHPDIESEVEKIKEIIA